MCRARRRMFVDVVVVVVRTCSFDVRMPAPIVMTEGHAHAGTRGGESLDGHRQRQSAGKD
jgi:hypothetical protein